MAFRGFVAKFLGQYFDELVTQLASGRASRLNKRLNDEILEARRRCSRNTACFERIDYTPSEVILHFDLTRFRAEGIAGYVFAATRPGTVPLYRWLHPRDGSHYYTTVPNAPDRPNSVSEGISCHIYDHPVAGNSRTLSLAQPARRPFTRLSPTAKMPARVGYRHYGIAGYILSRSTNRGPRRSTASSTQSGISTFTRCIRMPNSRNKLCAVVNAIVDSRRFTLLRNRIAPLRSPESTSSSVV